jgi:hypothetical protein
MLVSVGCRGATPAASAHPKQIANRANPTALPSPSLPSLARKSPLASVPSRPVRVTAQQLGKSWHTGCPVPPSQLRGIWVSYWGFDEHPHYGELIVNVRALPVITAAFAALRRAHFPIRRMTPIAAYGGCDSRSVAHDNTSAFNCRFAVANGPKTWSEHAFGDAVDIDPRENPYRLGGRILPPSGAAYADRNSARPGMILAAGPVVRAFDRLGWGWGGRWSSTPDYQHFSVNGR